VDLSDVCLTVFQTSHHHLGMPHSFREAHHRRPAPLPLLAPVGHPIQQDGRSARKSPGHALEDGNIHVRLAPADAAPGAARERRPVEWHDAPSQPARANEAGRAHACRPYLEPDQRPCQDQRAQAQRYARLEQVRQVRLLQLPRKRRPWRPRQHGHLAAIDDEAPGVRAHGRIPAVGRSGGHADRGSTHLCWSGPRYHYGSSRCVLRLPQMGLANSRQTPNIKASSTSPLTTSTVATSSASTSNSTFRTFSRPSL
jgi:hypothetical protein